MAVRWQEGDLLWAAGEAWSEQSRLTEYAYWLRRAWGLSFSEYETLWQWSVDRPGEFWQSIWDYFGVRAGSPPREPLALPIEMPGARWFPGATLNYAEHALQDAGDCLAVIHWNADGEVGRLSRAELAAAVARAREGLLGLGVEKGDRVVACLPNGPEALIAFLATASLGALWASVSPELEVPAILERFTQIDPKVLLIAEGDRSEGDHSDRREAIRAGLPTLSATVRVERGERDAPGTPDAPGTRSAGRLLEWDALLATPGELRFEALPFDHPLWILFGAEEDGQPRAIVQGHGGILLEHLKTLALHFDLGPSDRFFWSTTPGETPWNLLVSGLLVESVIILREGPPDPSDLAALWRMAEATGMTYFGSSARFLRNCQAQGLIPRTLADLSCLRGLGAAGGLLPADGFGWVYESVSSELMLGAVRGGADLCSAVALSSPWRTVRAGEAQCRALGFDLQALDSEGEPVVGTFGDLVLGRPTPSMPVAFWNDEDGRRLRAAYHQTFPGKWHHGQRIKITERSSCVVHESSDDPSI